MDDGCCRSLKNDADTGDGGTYSPAAGPADARWLELRSGRGAARPNRQLYAQRARLPSAGKLGGIDPPRAGFLMGGTGGSGRPQGARQGPAAERAPRAWVVVEVVPSFGRHGAWCAGGGSTLWSGWASEAPLSLMLSAPARPRNSTQEWSSFSDSDQGLQGKRPHRLRTSRSNAHSRSAWLPSAPYNP